MTKREFLDTVFALAPNEANAIMDAFDEYVESNVVPTGRSGKERRMSKKYVIDIPNDAQYILINGASENHCYTRMEQVDDIEELNSDYINEHYGSLQDEAYQRGLEDGKKHLANGCVGCQYEGDEGRVNPCCECARVCDDHYIPKTSDRIEVGDEVIWTADNITLIVTSMYEVGGINWCDGLAQDGKVYSTLIENDRKTGKHYDIQSILEAMRT
jgi:hypothetical protein